MAIKMAPGVKARTIKKEEASAPPSPDTEEKVEEKPEPAPIAKQATVKPAMKINILAMKKAAEEKNKTPSTLCLLVVAPRQGGKSTLLGTCSGTMMLFTTSDESHSIETAITKAEATYKATIVPCIIDMETEKADGSPLDQSQWQPLTADQSIAKLNSWLDSLLAMDNLNQEVQYVALDSLYSIFKRINEKKNIQTAKAMKNNFRAQEIALKELLDLNQKLVMLQRKGINVIVTCPAAAEQDKTTGLYSQLEPLLEGYRNNLHVVGIFPDICTVGYASFENEDGEVESGYYLQFGGNVMKSGKKISGEERCINFAPRISGLLHDETPDAMEADLTELANYKSEMKAKRGK